MTDANAFLAALAATPDDQALRCAFADWLLERDYPLTAAVLAGTPRDAGMPYDAGYWSRVTDANYTVTGLHPDGYGVQVWPDEGRGSPVTLYVPLPGRRHGDPARSLRVLLPSLPVPGPNEVPD